MTKHKTTKLITMALAMALSATGAAAQESQTVYNFLRLPTGARAAALGGDNVTLIEDDASLINNNPALLSSVSDKTVALNFMSYMAGSAVASASFNRTVGERASWAVTGQYVNYGKMKQTTADNVVIGDFSAKDIAIGGYFSYMLGNSFAGGVAAKFITSYIGSYNSMAVGVDLGLNYFDSEREWSLSLVARNLGGQINAYDDNYEPMPFDLQLGASKRFAHTPFRVSATLVDLNHWNYRFANHLVLGLDAALSEAVWLGLGYNFRRANEMSIDTTDGGSAHGAGLSFGGGVSLERFKISVAYGKYHVSSSSLLVSAAFSL